MNELSDAEIDAILEAEQTADDPADDDLGDFDGWADLARDETFDEWRVFEPGVRQVSRIGALSLDSILEG